MGNINCASCLYSRKFMPPRALKAALRCQKSPPVLITGIDPATNTPGVVPVWPPVPEDGWCGEYSPGL